MRFSYLMPIERTLNETERIEIRYAIENVPGSA